MTARYPRAESFRAAFAASAIAVYAGTVSIEAEFAAKRPAAGEATPHLNPGRL